MLAAPMLLAGALAAIYLIWEPPAADLSAQVFRADLFADHGFLVWSNDWYAGHYLPGYSLIYPPLGAALGPRLAGALACVAAAGLFAALAQRVYGRRARLGVMWFAAGTVTMLLSGRITFAIGVAVGLGALLAMQRGRLVPAVALAVLSAAASPVAAFFVAIAAGAVALCGDRREGTWVGGGALAGTLVLALAFPTSGSEPFVFSSFVAIPLAAAAAYLLLPGHERQLRTGFLLYAGIALVGFSLANPVGGNLARLGALFAGPVLALAVRRRAGWAVAAVAAGLLFWQWTAPVRDVATALGDPSTERSYYVPLLRELRDVTGGTPVRIEVPPTQDRGEAAYVAPEFPLARGWLRQLEADDLDRFRDGRLTRSGYRSWLERNAVSYVAVPDADLDYLADDEAALIRGGLPYLREVWSSEDWRLYAVRDPAPLVTAARRDPAIDHLQGGRSQEVPRMSALGVDSFALRAPRPGAYLARVHYTRFWRVDEGDACVERDGDWTRVEARTAGRVRVEAPFTLAGLVGAGDQCSG